MVAVRYESHTSNRVAHANSEGRDQLIPWRTEPLRLTEEGCCPSYGFRSVLRSKRLAMPHSLGTLVRTMMLARKGWVLANVALPSLLGCSNWPIGGRLGSDVTGLTGDWIPEAQVSSADHLLLRFQESGRSELVHVTTRLSRVVEEIVWSSRWELHESATGDSRPLVCFNVRGGRGWPSCKLAQVAVVNDSSGKPRRRLTLEGWVGNPHMTAEVWVSHR